MKEITNNDLLMPAVYTSNSRFIAVNINQLDQDIWATTQNIADVFAKSGQWNRRIVPVIGRKTLFMENA